MSSRRPTTPTCLFEHEDILLGCTKVALPKSDVVALNLAVMHLPSPPLLLAGWALHADERIKAHNFEPHSNPPCLIGIAAYQLRAVVTLPL